jgi:hypothetical protein
MINIQEEIALSNLHNFLHDNPEMFTEQRKLERRMQNLTTPEERLEFLLYKIRKNLDTLRKCDTILLEVL